MKRRLKIFAELFAILLLWECAHVLIATGVRMMTPAVEQQLADVRSGIVDVTQLTAEDRGSAPPASVLSDAFGIPAAYAQYTIDVTARGAVGDGTTDCATAFQLAATRLVDTGGVIWVPPDGAYKISSTVDNRSDKPIYVVSGMGHNGLTTGGYITPGATLTNGIFRWRALAGETVSSENGGGGCIGVRFMDPATRAITIDSAIYVEDGTNFRVVDCHFINLAGRALRIGNSDNFDHVRGHVYGCGDTSKPAIDVAGGPNDAAHNLGFAGYYGRDVKVQASYNAPSLKVGALCLATIDGIHFENDTGTAALQNSFIECIGKLHARNCKSNALGAATIQFDLAATAGITGSSIIGCEFRGEGKAIHATNFHAQLTVNDNFFADAGADAVDAVTFDGGYLQFNDNTLYSSGKVWVIGPESMVCNNRVYASLETTPTAVFDIAGDTIASNNTGEWTATELTVASGVINTVVWKKTYTVDTEADAGSDDLNTIGGAVEGYRFFLRASHTDRSVVFKHATGNIQCDGNTDITLDSTNDIAECFYNGSKVIVKLWNGGT